ncbi:MAG: metallophosphoesterase family protein [Lachnospiraceae bacterium]|jgi:exonuclease SbcD
MKLIHTADVRLGLQPDEGYPWSGSRAAEIWDTFRQLLSVCREQKTDLLLISGNLFDRQPTKEELSRAAEIFDTAPQTQIVLTAGNRDYLSKDCPYRDYEFSDHVHLLRSPDLTSIYLEKLDVTVHGMSYDAPVREDRVFEAAFPDDEGEIQILIGYGGEEHLAPFDPVQLEEACFDYAAFGGKRTFTRLPGNLYYPGSPEPTGLGDTGPHGYISGEIADGSGTFRFVPFAVRRYVNLKCRVTRDLTQQELETKLKSVIRRSGPENIYRIRLEGTHRPTQPFDVNPLYAAGNIASVEDRTIPAYDIAGLLEAHRGDVIGMYMEEFAHADPDAKSRRAFFAGLDALLRSDDDKK